MKRSSFANRLFLIWLISVPFSSWAQQVEMADTFRKEGKIYVVILVIFVVFLGIILYLIQLDRKISKIEKNNKSDIHSSDEQP